MKRWLIVLLFACLTTAEAATAQEKRSITNQSVSNPSLLRQLLVNRFDLVESDIENLQVAGNLGRAKIFYVYSVTGASTYTGEDKDHPLATLDQAVDKCTANRGDIIVVLQNHAETLAGGADGAGTADGVDIDIAGVTVIGLGTGDDRPTFTFDTTTDEFVIGRAGDNVTIYNLVFFPSVSECVHGVDIEDGADNVAIINCEFIDSTTAANEFDKMITVAVEANDLTIEGCRFTSADAAGGTDAIEIGDGVVKGLRITNCTFYGDWDPAAVFSDQINTNVLIESNVFYNANTDERGVEFTDTTSTGSARWNTFITSGNYIDSGGLAVNGNFYKTIGDSDTDSWTFDLGTNNLDHLAKTAVANGDNMEVEVVDGTILSQILTKTGDTSDYLRATMSIEYLAETVAAIVVDTADMEATSSAILAQLAQAGVTLGKVWYVDSTTGLDADTGATWALAEATLSAALGDCTTNKGDVVFIAPGHTEDLAAAQLDIAKNDIRIIGLGTGTGRPTFTFSNAAASWLISAESLWVENVIFRATVTGVLIGVNFDNDTAHGCTLKNCLFDDSAGGGGEEFITAVNLVAGADFLTIDGCELLSPTAGATSAIASNTGVCDRITIKNCRIYGDYSTAAVSTNQTHTLMLIANNVISNTNTGDWAIELTGAPTGECMNNRLYADAYATILDPGSLMCIGNLAVDAIDEGGYPIPILGDSVDNYLGRNSANNDALTDVVVANRDGSSLERQEELRELALDALGLLGSSSTGVGKVVYLDYTSGNDTTGDGTTWALAEKTLSAAFGDCTNNKGDVILIAPDHTETLEDAQLDIAAIGVRIIGLGVGINRPEFLFHNANSSWLISGSNLTFENLIFRATITGVLIGVNFDNTTAHFNTLENCLFEDAAGGADFVVAVSMVAGVDFLTIDNCEFISPTAGATTAIASSTGVCDRTTVKNCRIFGDYSTAAINTTQTHTGMLVQNNAISNYSAADYAILLTGAPTGQLVNNWLYTSAYATTLDPGSLMCIGNMAVDAVDEGAYPIPVLGDSVDNYIGRNSADNDATTAAVVANVDGSVLERLESVQQGTAASSPVYNGANYLTVTAAFDGTTGAAHWGNSGETDEILTVTGAVRIKMLMECTETCTGTDGGTIALWVATADDIILAATIINTEGADATNLDITEIWLDTSPTEHSAIGNSGFFDFTVVAGLDVGLDCQVQDIADGTIIFHVWWVPLDSTGLVTAGAGGTL